MDELNNSMKNLLGKYPNITKYTVPPGEFPEGTYDRNGNEIISSELTDLRKKWFEQLLRMIFSGNNIHMIHTSELKTLCSHAISSHENGQHTEIVDDIITVLLWKTNTYFEEPTNSTDSWRLPTIMLWERAYASVIFTKDFCDHPIAKRMIALYHNSKKPQTPKVP